MRGLHFTLQYRQGLRWRTAKSYPLDEDVRVLTSVCGLARRQGKSRYHWRVLLMPVNLLICTTDLK